MAKHGKITKIEFIDAGFKAILATEETKNLVSEITDQIAVEANANGSCDGFRPRTIYGNRAHRYIGFVTSTTNKSAVAESENKALTRAVH
jgi:hypothetical protein